MIINDTAHEVPFNLSVITLGDFVNYHDQFGRDLDKHLEELRDKEYTGDPEEIELNRSIDLDEHLDLEAIAWYSFWTKHELAEVKEQPFMQPVLDQYRLFRYLLKEEQDQVIDFPATIEFNGEEWVIQDFKVNPSSDMTYNEIITSKEVMRQIFRVGKGKWDGLPYLCAVFFRKKNERFYDTFIQEDSERLNLLNDLPLKHALQVAFFLSICVSIWSNTLVSSAEKEQETLSPSS